jgi:RHS repeat-associated protein
LGSHVESRGWIDQRNDPETGLTYLHARYYDSQLGLFLSPDPIGVQGGLNLYGYGLGNPISNADRTGLDTRDGSGGDRCRDSNGFVPAECQGPDDGDPFEICVFCDDSWRNELPDWIQNPVGPGWRRRGDERRRRVIDQPPKPDPCLTDPSAEGCPNYCPDGNCNVGGPGQVPGPGGPPGSGSIVVETDPFSSTNPAGVFDPRDPNELLRRPPTQNSGFRFEQVFPFSDPCTVGFWTRWAESTSYLKHASLATAIDLYHAVEYGVPIVGGIATAVYVESAGRHGAIPWLVGNGAFLGADGRLASISHAAKPLGPFVVAAILGGVVGAGIDAAHADNYCH